MFDTGGARKCRCQALKVPGWIWRDTTQEERDAALLEQTGCGTSGPTSGLLGYVDGEPAGWVAVEPRENYPRSGRDRRRGCGWTLSSRASVTPEVVGFEARRSGAAEPYRRRLQRAGDNASVEGWAPELLGVVFPCQTTDARTSARTGSAP